MGLELKAQEQDQWCWAAVASSVDKYINPSSTWDQCRVVDASLPMSPCVPAAPPNPACNQGWSLSKALTTIGRKPGLQDQPLEFAELRAQLIDGYPVCARIVWNGGGAHFVIIDGCWSKEEWVSIRDPYYIDQAMPYEEFKTSYLGIGRWQESYLVR